MFDDVICSRLDNFFHNKITALRVHKHLQFVYYPDKKGQISRPPPFSFSLRRFGSIFLHNPICATHAHFNSARALVITQASAH